MVPDWFACPKPKQASHKGDVTVFRSKPLTSAMSLASMASRPFKTQNPLQSTDQAREPPDLPAKRGAMPEAATRDPQSCVSDWGQVSVPHRYRTVMSKAPSGGSKAPDPEFSHSPRPQTLRGAMAASHAAPLRDQDVQMLQAIDRCLQQRLSRLSVGFPARCSRMWALKGLNS